MEEKEIEKIRRADKLLCDAKSPYRTTDITIYYRIVELSHDLYRIIISSGYDFFNLNQNIYTPVPIDIKDIRLDKIVSINGNQRVMFVNYTQEEEKRKLLDTIHELYKNCVYELYERKDIEVNIKQDC